jgi:hypothetical protein
VKNKKGNRSTMTRVRASRAVSSVGNGKSLPYVSPRGRACLGRGHDGGALHIVTLSAGMSHANVKGIFLAGASLAVARRRWSFRLLRPHHSVSPSFRSGRSPTGSPRPANCRLVEVQIDRDCWDGGDQTVWGRPRTLTGCRLSPWSCCRHCRFNEQQFKSPTIHRPA